MPDRYEHALHLLGLEPGATEQAVKDAYRDMVKVWHPDRFGSDPRLRAKAQEKLKEVNAAFEQLRGYRASDYTRARESARPANTAGDSSWSRVPESPVERASHLDTRTVLLLFLCVAVIAVAGTGLFVSRSRPPEEPSAAPEPIEAPEPIYPSEPIAAPEPTPKPAPVQRPIQKRNPVPKPEPIQTRTPAGSADVSAAPQPANREPAAPPPSAPGAPREPVVTLKTGSLIVTSRPMGAHVSFDGRVIGDTPIIVTDVTPGEHRIELRLDGNGYQPWSSSVVVPAGREEKLLAVLTPTGRGR